MYIEGFQDFAFLAFDPRYEKTGAPLSKRRNGRGPIHHYANKGPFFGSVTATGISTEAAMAGRFAIYGVGALLALGYAGKVRKGVNKATEITSRTLTRVSMLSAARAAVLGTLVLVVYNDVTR
jgi:hypothetical protein